MQTATANPTAPKVTRPRADALRNRERIVTAAREMFVEFGPDVPLDEIARRAGVGNATVYRNFPTGTRWSVRSSARCWTVRSGPDRPPSPRLVTRSGRWSGSCTSPPTSGSARSAR